MRKIGVLVIGVLLSGCAVNSSICKDQVTADKTKAYIRSALQVAQVGYPIVAAMAGVGYTSPFVVSAVANVDASLDGLGQLTHDVLCPGPTELQKAEVLLNQAQEAKKELGIK